MAITLFITVLLASPQTFEVELGRDASARIVSSSDSSQLNVEVVTTGEPVRLHELKVPPAVTASVEHVGKRHAWLILSTDRAFSGAQVRAGRVTTLVVTVAERDEPLRKRLLEKTPELGGALGVANGLRPADQAIAAGRFADAARILGKIGESAPAHAWAVLRTADVTMLSGDRDQGCRGYADVRDRYRDRTVSLLARLRQVSFACTPGEDADWIPMLTTIKGLDGGLGVWVGREAAFTMQTLTTPAAVDAALDAVKNVRGGTLRPNANAFRDALVARAVATRRGKPVDLASWVTDNGELVVKHPDAAPIRVETARALRELDLQQRAIAIMTPLLAGSIPRPDAPLGVWSVLTDVYSALGDVNGLTALKAAFALQQHDQLEVPEQIAVSKAPPAPADLDSVFVGLERRLQRVRRHLGKEAP